MLSNQVKNIYNKLNTRGCYIMFRFFRLLRTRFAYLRNMKHYTELYTARIVLVFSQALFPELFSDRAISVHR